MRWQAKLAYIDKQTPQLTQKAMSALMPSVAESMDSYNKTFESLGGGEELRALHHGIVELMGEAKHRQAKPNGVDGPQWPSDEAARAVLPAEKDVLSTHLTFLLRLLWDAQQVLPHFEREVEDALKGLEGVKVKKAPLKTISRALAKTMEENGGDFSQLQDLVRISVECVGYNRMSEACKALKARGMAKLCFTRYKDRTTPEGGFDSAVIGGYRDVMLNGLFTFEKVQHLVEVQIHHKDFLAIKSSPKGHAVYKAARELHGFDQEMVRHEGPMDAEVLARAERGLLRFIDARCTPCWCMPHMPSTRRKRLEGF